MSKLAYSIHFKFLPSPLDLSAEERDTKMANRFSHSRVPDFLKALKMKMFLAEVTYPCRLNGDRDEELLDFITSFQPPFLTPHLRSSHWQTQLYTCLWRERHFDFTRARKIWRKKQSQISKQSIKVLLRNRGLVTWIVPQSRDYIWGKTYSVSILGHPYKRILLIMSW